MEALAPTLRVGARRRSHTEQAIHAGGTQVATHAVRRQVVGDAADQAIVETVATQHVAARRPGQTGIPLGSSIAAAGRLAVDRSHRSETLRPAFARPDAAVAHQSDRP